METEQSDVAPTPGANTTDEEGHEHSCAWWGPTFSLRGRSSPQAMRYLQATLAGGPLEAMVREQEGEMEHKDEMTIGEWVKARTELADGFRSLQLERQDDVECARTKVLDPNGETFPFQCSCGVTHQFEYTENEGARLLVVK